MKDTERFFMPTHQNSVDGYPRVRSKTSSELIYSYLSALGTARALTVWMLYDADEHHQLVELQIDPLWYTQKDWEKFRSDYAATSLLAKADFLKLDLDTKEVALEKLVAAERQCAAFNSLLSDFTPQGYDNPERLLPGILEMQREVARILGDYKCDELFEECDFGPGVTLSLTGKFTDRAYKYHYDNGITRDLYDLIGDAARAAFPTWYVWEEVPPKVPGNRVTFVPKNAKTDRAIAVEPGLNLFFQKGVGKMIRRRLLRNGINLNDQGRNQSLARQALKLGLATIDFSSASDLIASSVVQLLVVNHRWYRLLSACRSAYGVLPDKTLVCWEKFSSMGNGFTFELESLIFFAIARTIVRRSGGSSEDLQNISVYGDDVILPQKFAQLFIATVEQLGFKVNTEKSYTQGLFFESCGKHYFAGHDVTPIYLKQKVECVSHLYRFHNSVRRLATRWGATGCDARFQNVCHLAVKSCPRTWRFGIPDTLGDGGFIKNFDEVCPQPARLQKRYLGWEGFALRHVVDRPKPGLFDGHGLLLSRLRQVGVTETSSGNQTAIRHQTTARVISCVVDKWIDLGPWEVVTP